MAASPPAVTIERVTDFASLAPQWCDLQQRAAASFFQSWAWTGCLAEARFDDPWLLTARQDGRAVALAMFNQGPRARLGIGKPILLGESGKAVCDSIFIEHNGLLVDRSESEETARACWAALDGRFGRARWVLSGVPESAITALPEDRVAKILARRPAPYLDLSPNIATLDRLSANTRQQIRRSLRAWEEIGPLRLDIAATDTEADMFLNALAALHQQYWIGRGKPGAFAEPFFGRFHHALIHRAAAGQSVDLMRIAAGDRIVGYLYNFVQDGWVAAYQSGFAFGPDADILRPGLVCHLMAIEHYRRAGRQRYDFLGGEARYKRSFADMEIALLWAEVRHKLPWQSRRAPVSSP